MPLANSARINVGNADDLKTTFQSFAQTLGIQVDSAFQEALDEVSKEAVKKLRSDSPKGHGKKHYASGWAYARANSKRGRFKCQIYNKTKPGLAHLLEHGHEVRDRNYDAHGSTNPKVHIQPVADWVDKELPKRISQKMSK